MSPQAWNKVFFGLECIKRGTFVITLFYGALLASTYLFYNIDNAAGYYLLPTCAWVTVATALQYSIYFHRLRYAKVENLKGDITSISSII